MGNHWLAEQGSDVAWRAFAKGPSGRRGGERPRCGEDRGRETSEGQEVMVPGPGLDQ